MAFEPLLALVPVHLQLSVIKTLFWVGVANNREFHLQVLSYTLNPGRSQPYPLVLLDCWSQENWKDFYHPASPTVADQKYCVSVYLCRSVTLGDVGCCPHLSSSLVKQKFCPEERQVFKNGVYLSSPYVEKFFPEGIVRNNQALGGE